MDDHFFGDDRGYRWALHAIAFSIDATCACNQTDSSICCSPGNQRCSLLPGPTPTPPTFIFQAFVRTFLLPLPNSPPTRIPRFVKAYAYIFHFDSLISFVFRTCTCISAYIHEYVKYNYLKSSKRIKGYELLLLNDRNVAIKYRVLANDLKRPSLPRTKRLDR